MRDRDRDRPGLPRMHDEAVIDDARYRAPLRYAGCGCRFDRLAEGHFVSSFAGIRPARFQGIFHCPSPHTFSLMPSKPRARLVRKRFRLRFSNLRISSFPTKFFSVSGLVPACFAKADHDR
jgi:hypothetical protein